MLPEGTFSCSFHNGVAVCVAQSRSAEAVYQQLAVRVKTALAQMSRAGIQLPVQEITIGPTIGAAMVIAVQGIVGALAVFAPPPAAFHPLLSTQTPPAQMIAIVGKHADEILAYVDQVLMARPDAFQLLTQPPPPPPASPAQQALGAITGAVTAEQLVAIGTGVLVVGSLIALARSSDRRLSGRVDRTGFLDADDDDDDDGGDGGDVEAELPDVIDAESTESPAPAP